MILKETFEKKKRRKKAAMRKRFSHSMKNNRTTIEGLYHICPSMSVIPRENLEAEGGKG